MQTLLYVLGPFLLQAGLGCAALIVAFSFVAKILVPRARFANANRRLTEQYLVAAEERFSFTNELAVEFEMNALLQDALSGNLRAQLHSLPAPPNRKKVT